MKITWSLLYLLILFPSVVCGSDKPAAVLMEKFTEVVKVSGGLKVGAMFSNDTAKAKNSSSFSRIYLSIPPDMTVVNKQICLELTSRDGKYYGLFSKDYEENLGKNGIFFRSAHQKQIEGYFPEDMAVLASVEDSCERRSKKVKYVLAGWSDVYDINMFSIYLNSLVHRNSIEVVLANRENITIPCSTLIKERSSGYNVQCDINLSGINKSEIKKFRIQRYEPGENYRPDLIRLNLEMGNRR